MGTPDSRPATTFARIARRYGHGLPARKLEWMAVLARSQLRSARQVRVLHEALCFLEAYPDDARVLRAARRMLREFRDRADLKRHRHELTGSGIVGTDTPFRFFWPTAHWITRNWPGALVLERDDSDHARAILEALPLLLGPAQAEWLRNRRNPTLAVLDRLRPDQVTDADFLIGLVEAMPCNEAYREAFFDRMDPPFLLRAGPATPQRTTARLEFVPSVVRPAGPDRSRPDLHAEARRAPRKIRRLRAPEVAALIRLARISMITRERDVAVFQYPNLRDGWLVDDGGGLAFAWMGIEPPRRALLPATYAGLTLQNGVPVGYIQIEPLGLHAAVSFNTFETFRGGEAAHVLARLIAAARDAFGCKVFSIEPYQLGDGNDEGIESAAWWFYQRNGFRPQAREARRLAKREIQRATDNPEYRSSARILKRLARWHVFFTLDPTRRARLPKTAEALQAAVQELRRFGQANSTERRDAATAAARAVLRAGSLRPGSERTLANWAGVVLALARRGRLSGHERRLLLAIIEAKASESEREYLRLLRRHERLCQFLDC
jgi:hypothetical protein